MCFMKTEVSSKYVQELLLLDVVRKERNNISIPLNAIFREKITEK